MENSQEFKSFISKMDETSDPIEKEKIMFAFEKYVASLGTEEIDQLIKYLVDDLEGLHQDIKKFLFENGL